MAEDMNIEETQEMTNEQPDIKEDINAEAETFSEENKTGAESGDTKTEQTSVETEAEDIQAETSNESEDEASVKKDKKDEKIDELTDKYKRLFAEFDNFRKRTDTEKAGMYAEGERAVLVKVLNIVDNFERALASVPEELKGNSYVEGMEKIYRSTLDTLKELGTEPIEAVGKEFDANLHNAVMHVEDENAGENIVVEEFQKGYMFRDKVLRYSMVKVAN